MDNKVEEFEYTLLGRSMRFKRLSGGQVIMMQRMYQRGRKMLDSMGDDKEQMFAELSKLNVQTLDIIESLFLDPEDVELVQQAMLEGKVDMDDLRPILSGGKETGPPPDDDADPVDPPKTLKSKKPAATAKVTAKKTANPRRAAR